MNRVSKYTCAVVTPIGPGHDLLYQECEESILDSFHGSSGFFSDLMLIAVDDLRGLYGRSRARNMGVKKALENRADWIFFLDADDLMAPAAFERVSPYLLKHDAVWGRIDSFAQGCRPEPREGQIENLDNVLDIIRFDPFLTLQIGHFVRARVAFKNPFDPLLDAGEDFDYYLRIWSRYQCTKIPEPLFFNRRGAHSSGPRSADGAQWREAAEERILHYALKWGLFSQERQPREAVSA